MRGATRTTWRALQSTTTDYNAFTVTTIDAGGRQNRLISDALGRAIRAENLNASGVTLAVTQYLYDKAGNVTTVQTTAETAVQISSPAAASIALRLPAGATAETLNTFIIPTGTRVFVGGVEGGASESTRGRSPVLVRYPSRRGRTSNDAMSRAFAQWKAREALVATYTPPFVETLRVDVLQRPIELTAVLGKDAQCSEIRLHYRNPLSLPNSGSSREPIFDRRDALARHSSQASTVLLHISCTSSGKLG
jgi:hypothetical protein